MQEQLKQNPLLRFIARRLHHASWRALRREIVGRMQPTNSAKLYRRLDAFFETGLLPDSLSDKLSTLFSPEIESFHLAVRRTREQASRERTRTAEASARSYFYPHLYRLTERRMPRQLSLFAITNGSERWLKIPVPENIMDLDRADTVGNLQSLIERDRYKNEGIVRNFLGKTTGFILRPNFETGYYVSLWGEVNWEPVEEFREPTFIATVQ